MYSFSQYQSLLECLLQKWHVSLINSFKLYGFLYMIAEYIPNKQQQQQQEQENPMKSMGNNG